jgi:hypothetical protein
MPSSNVNISDLQRRALRPEVSIQRSILNRFAHVARFDALFPFEIGKGFGSPSKFDHKRAPTTPKRVIAFSNNPFEAASIEQYLRINRGDI